MPKSKRQRVVALTRTSKKGRTSKESLVDQIRSAADEYAFIYIFNVANMRNAKLKEVRTEWKDSRFFFGKNRVMALALGANPEDEYRPEISKIAKRLNGNVGLLFTNRKRKEAEKWFGEFIADEFARSGFVTPETVTLPQAELAQFPHSMEPQLRKLGLPVSLHKGVVHMDREFVVCSAGTALTPEQARILKLFDKPLAKFQIVLRGVWSDNKYESLIDEEAEEATANGEDDEDEEDEEDDE